MGGSDGQAHAPTHGGRPLHPAAPVRWRLEPPAAKAVPLMPALACSAHCAPLGPPSATASAPEEPGAAGTDKSWKGSSTVSMTVRYALQAITSEGPTTVAALTGPWQAGWVGWGGSQAESRGWPAGPCMQYQITVWQLHLRLLPSKTSCAHLQADAGQAAVRSGGRGQRRGGGCDGRVAVGGGPQAGAHRHERRGPEPPALGG